MDQVTQQNAAMVEQATAATQALVGETSSLVKLIDSFDMGQEPGTEPTLTYPGKRTNSTAVPSVVNGRAAALRKAERVANEWEEF